MVWTTYAAEQKNKGTRKVNLNKQATSNKLQEDEIKQKNIGQTHKHININSRE